MTALIVALVLVGPELIPDCQRFCLGQCHYDRKHRRCADTRVEYIGAWDAVPTGYVPAEESDFLVHFIPDPPNPGETRLEGGSLLPEFPVAPPKLPAPTPKPAPTSCCANHVAEHTEE